MVGTEKQIAWANKIKGHMIDFCIKKIKKMEYRLSEYDPEFDGNVENIRAGIEYLNAAIRDIEEIKSANWFIDNRTDIELAIYIMFDDDYIDKKPIHGNTTNRVEIIKKYQNTGIRFSRG